MDEIDKLVMMSDEEILRANKEASVDDMAMMSDEELLSKGGVDPSQDLSNMGIPSASDTSEFESYGLPTPQEAIDFGKSAADDFSFGLGQHAAGWGAGLGKAAGEFQESGEPFLDRIGAIPQNLSEGFAQGKQEYVQELDAIRENMTPGERFASAIVGGLASAPLGSSVKAAKTLGGRVATQGGAQAGMAAAGSREETLEGKAWDAATAALLGTGMQTTGEVAGKAWEFGSKLASDFLKGGKRLFSAAQGIKPHLIDRFLDATPKQLKQWVKDFTPPGTERLTEDQYDVMAREIIDGIGANIRDHRDSLNKRIGQEIQKKYGNDPMTDEHYSFLMDKISSVKKRIGNIEADENKLLAEQVSKLEKILAKKEGSTTFSNIFGSQTAPTKNPSYSDAYDAYKQIKDYASPGYIRDGNVFKPGQGTKSTSLFKGILKGENGIQDGFIGDISPEVRALDAEFTKFYNAGKRVNTKLLTGKGQSRKYLENVGMRKSEALDTMDIDAAIPGINAQDKAEKFATLSMIEEGGLEPRSFAIRSALGTGAALGLGGVGYLAGQETGGYGALPFMLAGAATVPFLGKQAMRGARGVKNVQSRIGPTIENLGSMANDALRSPNAQRIANEELRKRLEESESQGSPLQ